MKEVSLKRKFLVKVILNKVAIIAVTVLMTTNCSSNADRLYPVGENRSRGYMNISGELIVEPTYLYAYYFYEGLGTAKRHDGTYDILNARGEVEFNLAVDDIERFREGFAAIEVDGQWGFINTEGSIVIEPQYRYVDGFSDGVSLVRRHDAQYLYIDKENRNIFGSTTFSRSYPFNGEYAVIYDYDEGEYGVINREGSMVIPIQYPYASNNVLDGLWAVENIEAGGTDFIDVETGQIALSVPYEQTGDFYKGYVPVRNNENGKWGMLDRNGNVVVDFQFMRISAEAGDDGLRGFEQERGFGRMTHDGEILIPAISTLYVSFKGGLARIIEDGRYGYVDMNGKIIYDEDVLSRSAVYSEE